MARLLQWETLGLIFRPEQGADWMRTHAQVPTPLLCDGFIRVYFASRPEPGLSLTSYVDLDADDPTRILDVCAEPILPLGEPGTFDEHGIMPSCAIRVDDAIFLYYSGWSRSASVPYVNSTGLAISEDNGKTFRKYSAGPILSRDTMNPYSATSPCILREDDQWDMWFCSGTSWVKIDGKYEHTYDIKHAFSENGIHWMTDVQPAIAQSASFEAITRPWVWREQDKWQMLYCYRGSKEFRNGPNGYRIAYAESIDAVTWELMEFASVNMPNGDWDRQMAAYPATIESGKSWLFYNGNSFGAGGFGLAVCSG